MLTIASRSNLQDPMLVLLVHPDPVAGKQLATGLRRKHRVAGPFPQTPYPFLFQERSGPDVAILGLANGDLEPLAMRLSRAGTPILYVGDERISHLSLPEGVRLPNVDAASLIELIDQIVELIAHQTFAEEVHTYA